MDYDKLIDELNNWNEYTIAELCGMGKMSCQTHCDNERCIVSRAATAITDLFARAEAAEARAEKAEKALHKLQSILYEPLIIEQNGALRPIKRTSRQDVYKTVLAAQAAAGIPFRWFPDWMKEE